LNALKLANRIVGVKPLPKNNCVKDNKNCHLVMFLSLSSVWEVFEKVQLRFLVVGHLHEDINESFRYLSKKLREQNNYVMVDLIQGCPFIF
jgi:hypothetical protein